MAEIKTEAKHKKTEWWEKEILNWGLNWKKVWEPGLIKNCQPQLF